MRDELMLRVAVTNRDHIGPGKVRLLELIDELGSISAAARAMDMSYRRAWLLVENMNAMFRAPVLTPAVGGAHGGGAVLTALGREIIARFRRMEAAARKAIIGDLAALKSRARSAPRTRGRGPGAAIAPPRLSRNARDNTG